jgi:glycosyltransferase involved in cell wall biosynthesis
MHTTQEISMKEMTKSCRARADTSRAVPDHLRNQITNPRLAARRPKVSILLITYNQEKYIIQALESVLMQETEYDYEINVIDDCSTDRTQEVVMHYAQKYPRIVRPYFNAENIGYEITQKNFYRGFQTLTGEYLAILEGDDYWSSPSKLQKQVAFLEANPDFAICTCNTVKIYEDASKEPHRFLYYGKIGDSTIEDVIRLKFFFHLSGTLYRNVFNGVPPHHYNDKRSCDIFVMISHAAFGKAHHIDEDMAVYRVHSDSRFGNRLLIDQWMFDIDGLRLYNLWMHYRYCKTFAEAISGYCGYVLGQAGKGESAPLSSVQFAKLLILRAVYGILYHGLDLPRKIHSVVKRKNQPPATKLAQLPPLAAWAEWHLIWGLNAKVIETRCVVADQPILQLTAISKGNRRALGRHALCVRMFGFLPRSPYRVILWVKVVADTNAHVQLRDSIVGRTGKPAHENDVWFDLLSQSVDKATGDVIDSGIEAAADGWLKAWIDFFTANGQIYVYLGLVEGATGRHTFEGVGEQLMFGGVEVFRVLPPRNLP